MLRRLLGKVDDGRFGRALAGMQAGWQWECAARHAERCGCKDAVARGVLCKHIAFAVMSELAAAAAARSAHRQLQVLGR